jgi:hypothetical protein
LFYEATGELNDAYISYQHAQDAYAHYAQAFHFTPPATLQQDLDRVSAILNGEAPDHRLAAFGPGTYLEANRGGELVVFSEIGFVPRKIQEEIDLPLYDNDIKRGKNMDLTVVSNDIAHRYHRGYHHSGNIDYWLRVALPKYETTTPQTRTVFIRVDSKQTQTMPAQNYADIAKASLEDRYPNILTRTVARSFAKYLTYHEAKKKNKVLGFLTNLFNVATEIADTRSWVSLPNNIQIGRLALEPGLHTITLEARDATGNLVETQTFDNVEIKPGQRTFLNHRMYQ